MKTIPTILSFCALIQLSTSIGQVQNQHKGDLVPNGSVHYRSEPLSNYYLQNGAGSEIVLYSHLQGIKKTVDADKVHVPLNLSVVIDKSGSMSGEKIENVKKATEYLVNKMSEEDFISIVLYDSDVEILCESQQVKDKNGLIKKIRKIITGSSTNLEGGMRKGFELVKSVKSILGNKQEMVNRVLLLSDGQANVGVVDPIQLSAISNKLFNEERISISTFGVGADYNEDLMTKIAAQAGGKYYFISSPELLPNLFAEELTGISSLVAKNTMLIIDFPKDKLKIDKVFLYGFIENNGQLIVNFNDVFSEEQKAVIIRFKPIGKLEGKIELKTTLSYTNATGNTEVFSHEKIVAIEPGKDLKEYISGFNKPASEGYALHASGEKFEEAMNLADNRQFNESKKQVADAQQLLQNHFSIFGEHPFLKDLYKSYKDYEDVIKDLENEKDASRFKLQIKGGKAKKFRSMSCPSF